MLENSGVNAFMVLRKVDFKFGIVYPDKKIIKYKSVDNNQSLLIEELKNYLGRKPYEHDTH